MKERKQNKVGQVMHRKGLETRRRIIDNTMTLLETSAVERISVADVARACSLTSPAFYLYFDGIAEVVLARLEEIESTPHPYVEMLNTEWEGSQQFEFSCDFVRAYADFWRQNRGALRYRNLKSEAGDRRFLDARMKMLMPIRAWFRKCAEDAEKSGLWNSGLDMDAAIDAAVLVLDNAAQIATIEDGYYKENWDPEKFLDSSAFMLSSLVQENYAAGAQCGQSIARENRPGR